MPQTKVLLVDDEKEFASTLSERLCLRNFDAKAVFCAEDALSVIRHESPDVILLDLKLPGMSGMELIRTIKLYDHTIEIIVLTGHGKSTDEIMSIVFDYVVKPVHIKEILPRIERAAQQRKEALLESANVQE